MLCLFQQQLPAGIITRITDMVGFPQALVLGHFRMPGGDPVPLLHFGMLTTVRLRERLAAYYAFCRRCRTHSHANHAMKMWVESLVL
jgi:hypothetical protein